MIIGIGTDLVNINRIQEILNRYGDKFRNKIFSKKEQEKAKSKSDEAGIYAKRWAAKEACSKALGTGIRKGITWQDMNVINLSQGQPSLIITGATKIQMSKLIPTDHYGIIHLSLSDDYPLAQAFVIIEALPVQEIKR